MTVDGTADLMLENGKYGYVEIADLILEFTLSDIMT